MPTPEEQQLLTALQAGSESALDQLFRQYYADLCRAVYRVLPDRTIAEDLVQDVFLDVWRKRENLSIKTSARAYLRRAAVNKTLNYIRDQRLHVEDEEKMPIGAAAKTPGALQLMEASELQEHLLQAIDLLPERCRLVFVLSRFEELSNKEIATQLEVSVKTVENQMTKALKLLRSALQSYMSVLIGLISTLVNIL